MKHPSKRGTAGRVKRGARRPGRRRYELVLYVTGMRPRSQRAIANLRAICEQSLKGRYSLKVVDLYQKHSQARAAGVIAAPTLVKKLPQPLRRLIGDMSDKERVLIGLDLVKRP